MTIRDALKAAAAQLESVSATPKLDAELLTAHALGISRDQLLLNGLEGPVPPGLDALVRRRLAHEPIAYITGWRDFWTLTLAVGAGVLVPRPDSEILIEAAIAHFSHRPPTQILDLGTGSGALLLAALSHWSDAKGLGVDRSPAALTYARTNADACGLGDRASFVEGNWGRSLDGQFDLILCNPPYIRADASLPPDVAGHEPQAALYAGVDGLADYRVLTQDIPRLLAPDGCACLELGFDQAEAVERLFDLGDVQIDLFQDLGGRDRCLRLTRKP
jgi:release factor glutamine methyltransferase